MQSAVSNIVEDSVRNLARKHNTTRFVRLHQLDAEMDDIAVPGILAYKDGECFANLVSIANELPAGREWSSSTLEFILQQYVLLPCSFFLPLLSPLCFIFHYPHPKSILLRNSQEG